MDANRKSLKMFGVMVIMMLLLFGMMMTARAEEAPQEVTSDQETLVDSTSNFVNYTDTLESSQTEQGVLNTQGLDTQAVDVSAQIAQAMLNHDAKLDVSSTGLLKDGVTAAIKKALASDPYLSAAMTSFSYSYSYNKSTNKVVNLYFYYAEDQATFTTHYNELKSAVSTALQCVDSSMSDEEKVLAIHDWLVLHTVYGTSNGNDAYTAYGVLVDGTGVCDGYARSIDLLLSEENIPSFEIVSTGMNHAWNMVEINGSWYHLDATWDDPQVTSASGAADLAGFVSYSNILQTDAGITATGHSGWDSSGITATSNQYVNMPRKNNNSQSYLDGSWYVANGQNLTATDFSGNNSEVITTGSNISGVQDINNALYYSQGTTIKQLNTSNHTSSTVYSLTSSELGNYYADSAYIYGLYPADNGQLGYRYYRFNQSGNSEAVTG